MFCTWHGPAWARPSSSWQPGAEEQRAQFHPAALPGCCSARRQLPAPARASPWVPGLPQPGARRVPCQTRLCPGSPDRKARGNVPSWSCWGCLRGTSLLSLLSAVQGKEGGVAPSHSTHLCLTHTGAGHRVHPWALGWPFRMPGSLLILRTGATGRCSRKLFLTPCDSLFRAKSLLSALVQPQ